jgi:parallel beta-helix repeat protein
MRKFAIIIVLLLSPIYILAETHYVSKSGSDEYPYTSWATAADSIQKGINAASYGDTVRVGAGSYREVLTLIPGIALLGAGMDSCALDPWGVLGEGGTMIKGADSSIIEGFHLSGRYPQFNCYGIVSSNDNSMALKAIKNNKITNFWEGVMLVGGVNPEISNNLFENNHSGIVSYFGARGLIINNTFTNHSNMADLWFSAGPTIRKNVIVNTTDKAIYGDFTDSMFFENNLVVVGKYYGVSFVSYGGFKNAPIRNNTIIGDTTSIGGEHTMVVYVNGFSNEITNNVLSNGYYAIWAYGKDGYYCNPQVSYNDLWDNVINYTASGPASIDTSLGGNIYLDPMFVGGDDYHLQYASPCINAGDPSIKDPDSSRSDIGCYGGTYGESYTYLDYPPKPPDSLSAVSESTVTILSWKPNTESDLSHYLVYKDTIAGFIPDTFKIVGNIPKDSSIFKDYNFVLGKTYYYRVSAWDLTGHKSEYSDELEVKATSVGEYVEEENRPPMYQLSQNYPNPFNSETMIWYYLPDVGYQPAEVEINIYNLLGKRVKSLVNRREYPGEHKIRWDGKDDSGKEVASGIYFYRLKVSGIELVKPKKMVLLK